MQTAELDPIGPAFESPKRDPIHDVRESVSGVLWAGSLVAALGQNRVCWAVHRLAELEEQLGQMGKALDLRGNDELRLAVQKRYEACLMGGERQAAESLRYAFEKYFVLGMPLSGTELAHFYKKS